MRIPVGTNVKITHLKTGNTLSGEVADYLEYDFIRLRHINTEFSLGSEWEVTEIVSPADGTLVKGMDLDGWSIKGVIIEGKISGLRDLGDTFEEIKIPIDYLQRWEIV